MTMLARLRVRVAVAAEAAGLGQVEVPSSSRDDGSPHVEPRGDRFDLVCCERGQELARKARLGMEDCAYELVFAASARLAQAQELQERAGAEGTAGGYSRWNWMGPHIAMLGRVAPAWGDRARAHYRAVLEKAPLTAEEVAAIRPGLMRG